MIKQSLQIKDLILTLLLTLFSTGTFAGTVYLQDFAGQQGFGIDGGTLNNFPPGGWTVDISNANLENSGDYVKVVTNGNDQKLVAQDVRGSLLTGSALWKSPLIDISNALDLKFSIDVFKTRGAMEIDDFVEIFYVLDGITTSVGRLSDDFTPNPTHLISNIADGLTLQILAEFGNGKGSIEQYAIDNVSVTGTTIPEPTTLALIGIGLIGISYRRKK